MQYFTSAVSQKEDDIKSTKSLIRKNYQNNISYGTIKTRLERSSFKHDSE